MLIVGVMALTELSTLAIRAADRSRLASAASIAADQKLEQLRALAVRIRRIGRGRAGRRSWRSHRRTRCLETPTATSITSTRPAACSTMMLTRRRRLSAAGRSSAGRASADHARDRGPRPAACGRSERDPAAIVRGGARRVTIRTRKRLGRDREDGNVAGGSGFSRTARTGQRGFSMIELLVATLLTMIVVAAVAALVAPSRAAAATRFELMDMEQRTRVAADTLGAQVSRAGAGPGVRDRSRSAALFARADPSAPSTDDRWRCAGDVSERRHHAALRAARGRRGDARASRSDRAP